MREYTLTQAEDLYELVKGRYRRGSLILTSNREPKDLYELFPTPVSAEGLLDRLLNSAYVITMLGGSYRPQQRHGSSSNGPSTSSGDLQVANYREHTTGNKRLFRNRGEKSRVAPGGSSRWDGPSKRTSTGGRSRPSSRSLTERSSCG
jgi:IstB-like ATP binding protein